MNFKGGHSHRRNWCQCSQCGKWFRRNRGYHEDIDRCIHVKVHFCSWSCSESASNEVDWETGWPYEPHFMHDEDLIPYQVMTDKGLIWVNTGNDDINI